MTEDLKNPQTRPKNERSEEDSTSTEGRSVSELRKHFDGENSDGGADARFQRKNTRFKESGSTTQDVDFKAYLKVSLANEELLNKLDWTCDSKKRVKQNTKKSNKSDKGLLDDCWFELGEGNGLKTARITWDKSSGTNYTFKTDPKLSGELVEKHDRQKPCYMLSHLRLNETYEIYVTVKRKKNKPKEVTIVFHTGPYAPSNFKLEKNTLMWERCDGAEAYHVKITTPHSEGEEHDTDDNKVTVNIDPTRSGVDANVTITSISKSGLQRTSMEQTVYFGDLYVPREIRAKLHDEDPYRSIDIEWSEPKQGRPDEYKLEIFTIDEEKHYDEVSTTSTLHTFRNLISGRAFYVNVSAVTGKSCHTARSRTVETHFKKRNAIDISDLGKAYDVETNFVDDKDNQRCNMEWKLPVLGGESANYVRKKVLVKAVDKMDPDECRTSSTSDTSGSFILKWGRKYNITIMVTYQDLDTLRRTDSVLEKEVKTDFEDPMDVRHEVENELLTVSWKQARGAKYYQVRVLNEDGIVCGDSESPIPALQTNYTLRIGPKLSSGNCTIEVISVDFAGNEKTSGLKRVSLASNDAPRSPRIRQSQRNPNRSLEIDWSKPVASISLYECSLYYSADEEFVVRKKETHETKVTFERLKQNTNYYAVIRSIKDDGERGHSCRTLACRTKSGRKKKSEEEITDLGSVSNLSLSSNPSNEGKVILSITWRIPAKKIILEEDYDLTRFEVECVMIPKGDVAALPRRFPLENDSKCKDFIEVSQGVEYTICVSAIYTDIDNGKEFRADMKKPFYAKVAMPDLKIKHHSSGMHLSWDRTNGVKSYKVRITDATNAELLFEDGAGKNAKLVPYNEKIFHGRLCYFTLIAEELCGKNTESEPKREIIGGNNLPHTLELAKVNRFPRRLLLTWAQLVGADDSSSKEVMLIEQGGCQPIRPTQVIDKSAEFRYLKSSTNYRAEIEVATNDRKITCKSNRMSTDKDCKSVTKRNIPSKIWFDESVEGKEYLRWEEVDLGEAFKTIGYQVTVTETGGWLPWKTQIIVPKQTVNETSLLLTGLKANAKYKATIQPKIWTVDEEKEQIWDGNSEEIHKHIGRPNLHEPEIEGNTVVFRWDALAAADEYELDITDAFQHTKIFNDHVSKANMLKTKLENELRVGRSCKVALTAIVSKSEKSTAWRDWVIGGREVPRDVTISKNFDNPRRRLNIRFTKPNCPDQPEKYAIRACPPEGRRRVLYTDKTEFTFKDLRQNTPYYFEVQAMYQGNPSRASKSTVERTDSDPRSRDMPSTNTFTGVEKAELTIQNSAITSTYNNYQENENAVPQSVRIKVLDDSCEQEDIVSFTWRSPLFSNNPENFVVENYLWKVTSTEANGEIVKSGETLPGEKQPSYETDGIALKLGGTYTFHITTKYENIDEDKANKESCTSQTRFNTRPCKPTHVDCRCEYDTNKLCVSWNSANGADWYNVELYILGESGPHRAAMCSKQKTSHNWKLNKDVEFGAELYAVVTALGPDKKPHKARSAKKIVGGDTVPVNAHAATDPESPTTAAIVQWGPPIVLPGGYRVNAILSAPGRLEKLVKTEECGLDDCRVRFKGLQPGTEYIFEVLAKSDTQIRGGCKTNKIQTTAGPGKVVITRAKPGTEDKSHSVEAEWKSQKGCSEYKIVVSDNSKSSRTFYTGETYMNINGLTPRTEYRITVAGGTGDKTGFGNESDPANVTTAFGRPSRAILCHSTENRETAVTLTFEESGESGVLYLACLSDDTKQVTMETATGSPVKFNDLLPNTQYHATVRVKYENSEDEGEEVFSNKIWTAPAQPTEFSAEAILENDDTSHIVKLKWEVETDCNEHRINVMRANKPEAELCVKGRNDCEYRCLDETCDYTFTVQTKNPSEIYSRKSEERRVKFPPARIKEVQAHLKKRTGEIEVTWEKPDNKARSYSITTMANDKVIKSDVSTNTRYEISPDNHTFKEYSFAVRPLDKDQQSPLATKSNVVKLMPPNVELTSAMPDLRSPANSMVITWEPLPISDVEYELRILLKGKNEHYEEETTLIRRGQHSCVYECASPGSKYQVRVQSKRDGVPGKWSKAMVCQLAPEPPSEVDLVSQNHGDKPKIEVSVKWKNTKPDYFISWVKGGNGENVKGPLKSEKENFLIEDGLRHGEVYDVFVQSVFADNEDFKSGKATSRIQIEPEKVHDVHVKDERGVVFVSWPELSSKPEEYVVNWARGSGEYQQEKVDRSSFEKRTQGTGESMRIRVAGVNGGGIGSYSDELIHRTVPSSPSDVRVNLSKNEPETCIIVDYADEALDLSKNYLIYVDEEKIGETHELRYDVKNLIPGSSYKVSVASIVEGRKSPRRYAPESITTASLVVTDVKAKLCKISPDGNAMTISWPPVGISVEEYEVNIFTQSLDEDAEPTLLKSVKEKAWRAAGERMCITVSSLSPGKFYSCTVAAVHKSALGRPVRSNRLFIGWKQPEKFHVSLDECDPSHGARLEWTRPPGVDTFKLSIKNDAGKVTVTKKLTGVDYHFENGTPGNTYNADLVWGSNDTFDSSSLSESFTLAPPPPTKISAVCKTDHGNPALEVVIECNQPMPDFYNLRLVEKTTGQIVHERQQPQKGNFVISSGLRRGEVYTVIAKSVFKGLEKYPSEDTNSDLITIPPGKVGGISIEEKNGLLIANWHELKAQVDHYLVYWAYGSDEYQHCKKRGAKFEISTPGCGETFAMRVAAVNAGGVGIMSDEIFHKTVPSPPTTALVEVSKNERETSLLLRYSDEVRDQRKNYAIYVNKKKVAETKRLEHRISGLAPGSTNEISVTSIVDERESEHCYTSEPGVTVPGQVGKIDGSVTSDRNMTVRWKHPNDIAPEKYKIEWKLNDGEEKKDIVYIPEFHLPRLETDATYKIRVAAENSSGQGRWSDFATCWTGPPAPRNVTARVEVDGAGNRYMDVKFDDEKDPAKKYYIVVIDNRGRQKMYLTNNLSTRIRKFGELQDAKSFSVGVYSMKGNVRSQISRATEQ